jgi:ribose transport system ATP-binding protein
MVGRDIKQFFHRTPGTVPPLTAGKTLLFEARGVVVEASQQQPIRFELRGGEIVGLAGLMGAGRTELAEAIFGIRPLLAGEVAVDGKLLRLRSPADAIAAGVYLVPEDRRSQGLLLEQSVKENISLPSLERLNFFGLVMRIAERELAERMRERLHIRTPSIEQRSVVLSGGNQQKIVIAKWLARVCRLLILDEPTRGIDVGAKAEIYALMRELAEQGVGVLMISSDLEEVLGVSDRVLVMHQGVLTGELHRAEMNEEAIMRLATGGER